MSDYMIFPESVVKHDFLKVMGEVKKMMIIIQCSQYNNAYLIVRCSGKTILYVYISFAYLLEKEKTLFLQFVTSNQNKHMLQDQINGKRLHNTYKKKEKKKPAWRL